jgi:hypothetical protein
MSTADELIVMIDKVLGSDVVPGVLRTQARSLLPLVPVEPGRVADELLDLATIYARTASYDTPTFDLYRCMPLRTVQKYLSDPAWKATAWTAFRQRVERHPDPGVFIRSTISAGTVIFEPHRSWLVDAPGLPTWTAEQLWTRLELGTDRGRPYVVFRLSVDRMAATGVGIRVPHALDAAAAGQAQWSPGGLQWGREFLDKAVTVEAVGETLWRP